MRLTYVVGVALTMVAMLVSCNLEQEQIERTQRLVERMHYQWDPTRHVCYAFLGNSVTYAPLPEAECR